MGGNPKQKPAPATKTTAPAVPVPTQTFQSFMPNEQQGLLAQQMAMGGYGTPESNAGILANLYRDVTMPIITRPDQIEQYVRQIGLTPATATAGAAAFDPTKRNQPVKPTASTTPATRQPYWNRDQNSARTM